MIETGSQAHAARQAVRLEIVTVIWMALEAALAIGAGVAARSVVLTAFGVDSVVELLSGTVLVWRMSVEAGGAGIDRVDRVERRATMAAAVLLVLAGKAAVLLMPFAYKAVIDGMSGHKAAFAVVAGLVAGYATARFAGVLSDNLRNALFEKVGQDAARRLAGTVFRHVHDLSLRFHLERRTGSLTKIVERGTKSIDMMLYFLLFNIGPTLIELTESFDLDDIDTLVVGDGANDLGMIQAAGLGVAYHAKPAVAAAAAARIDYGDLTALLYAQGYRREEFAD